MTNEKKFLKENTNITEMSNLLADYIYSMPYECSLHDVIYDFFGEQYEDFCEEEE